MYKWKIYHEGREIQSFRLGLQAKICKKLAIGGKMFMQSQDSLIMPGIKYAQAVALSYFHPKQGPVIGFLFPRDAITSDVQLRISEIMDKTYDEGFYSHSFGIYTVLD